MRRPVIRASTLRDERKPTFPLHDVEFDRRARRILWRIRAIVAVTKFPRWRVDR